MRCEVNSRQRGEKIIKSGINKSKKISLDLENVPLEEITEY